MNRKIIEKISMIVLFGLLCNGTISLVGSQTIAPAGVKKRYGGTFIYVLSSDPGSLNPTLTTSFNIGQASGPCYEGLTYDSRLPGFPPMPSLAESWESSEDSKTWTFHLQHNVTFHDGEKFTSADVKFTVEEVLVPYHPGGKTVWKDLGTVETPDDYTIVFKFDEPMGPLPTYVSDMWCSILPKHLWEGTDFLENPHNLDPVGTGPFKFEEYKKGEYVSYVKYEDYWAAGIEGKPYLDKVIARVIPSETMRGIAFEKGEVHYMACFIGPYPDAVRLSDKPGVYISTDLWNEQVMNYMIVDMGDPESPTSNKLVRQALAYAIDKEEFSRLTTFGFDKPATSVYSSAAWAYNPNCKNYTYNPAKAEELLDQAGYTKGSDGIRMTLKLRSWTADHGRKKAEVTADMLEEVGIACDIHLLEYIAHKDAVYVQGDYDIAFTVGYTTGPDPMIAGRFFTTAGIHEPPIAYTNTARYINSTVDEMYDAGVATSDIEERKACYYTIQEILMEDLPFIPITEAVFPQICSNEFIDIPPSGKGPRWGLQNVWWIWGDPLEAEEPEILQRVEIVEALVDDLSAKLDTLATITYAAIVVSIIAIIAAIAIFLKKKT